MLRSKCFITWELIDPFEYPKNARYEMIIYGAEVCVFKRIPQFFTLNIVLEKHPAVGVVSPTLRINIWIPVTRVRVVIFYCVFIGRLTWNKLPPHMRRPTSCPYASLEFGFIFFFCIIHRATQHTSLPFTRKTYVTVFSREDVIDLQQLNSPWCVSSLLAPPYSSKRQRVLSSGGLWLGPGED